MMEYNLTRPWETLDDWQEKVVLTKNVKMKALDRYFNIYRIHPLSKQPTII